MIKKIVVLFLFVGIVFGDDLHIDIPFLKMDYTEYGNGGEYLDSQKSAIVGVEVLYGIELGDGLDTYNGGDSSRVEFSGNYLKGKSDYDGFLFNASTGVRVSTYKSTTDMEIVEAKIRYIETKSTSNYDVGIFTSLGYRYWKRDMSGDPYGYLEEYKWAFGDIGLKVGIYDGNWKMEFIGAYQRAFKPTLYAGTNGGMSFDLGTTDGYNIEIPLKYNIADGYDVEVAYEYDYWEIGKSNTVNGFYEPDSKTKNQVIKIGLVFRW